MEYIGSRDALLERDALRRLPFGSESRRIQPSDIDVFGLKLDRGHPEVE